MPNPNGTPENLRPPWQAGESGNPDGRPKGSLTLGALLRRRLTELGPDGRAKAEAIVDTLLREAEAGDIKAIKEVFDRADGKAIPASPDADAAPDEAPKRIIIPGADGRS